MISRTIIMVLVICLASCGEETDPRKAFYNGDYTTSYKLWKPLAEQGDSEAQNFLAIHYHIGSGVDKDIKQAFHWYQQAAEAGNPDAQRNLGVMYESGELGNRDFEQAYIWLYAAYKQGNSNAAKTLKAISGQLSPGRVRKLKQVSMQYVKNDVIDPEADDF